eukprot:6159423-Alexandrium_andersonii.AAC.1
MPTQIELGGSGLHRQILDPSLAWLSLPQIVGAMGLSRLSCGGATCGAAALCGAAAFCAAAAFCG